MLPTQLERRIEWSDDPAPIARSYTVRSFDGTEVAIDVVVHSAGVATAWALACAPGDPIWLAGPKMGMLLPESTDWLLLAGDETALPAIARCLEELPSGMPAQVIVEVDGPESEQDLQAPDGVRDPLAAPRRRGARDDHAARGRDPRARSGGPARRSPGWPGRR